MYYTQLFNGSKNGIVEYDGKILNKYIKLNFIGTKKIKFTFVECNSNNKQLIVLSLDGVDCDIFWNGKKYVVPETRFPTLDLDESFYGKEIELEITIKSGEIYIYNGAIKKVGNKNFVSFCCEGCAMIKEKISQNISRYYCNDFEPDDDFNDLIFDLEILD